MNIFRKLFAEKLYSWYMYDWANSAYSTTVITLFMGPYLTLLAKDYEQNGLVSFLGFNLPSGSVFPYSISISVILQALLLPFLGALADNSNRKNYYLGIYTFVGSFATILFLIETHWVLASILLIISNFAFGCAIVIYNSFLNQLSNKKERQRVSSVGWAIGYLGGGLLLLINLLIFQNYEAIGISKLFSIKLNIALAGFWWLIFGLPAILNLKFTNYVHSKSNYKTSITETLKQIFRTLKSIAKNKVLFLFLIAYLLYNDGVQAVISLSSLFGQEELKLSIEFLTIVILVVQFFAAFGALFFNFIANRINEKRALLLMIAIWILILLYAYIQLNNHLDFFALALVIALVMGGTQAISRSVYSKLIPQNSEAEYFSFYEISEKGTSWMGPFLFGLTYQFTYSYRLAILSLALFFILGGILLGLAKITNGFENEISG